MVQQVKDLVLSLLWLGLLLWLGFDPCSLCRGQVQNKQTLNQSPNKVHKLMSFKFYLKYSSSLHLILVFFPYFY